ncbi:hypothetical protein BpHYR1_009860 [Brachionus plicatilis]|uniref:Uncharacterized protein n=1 Tax=Brachionus plicatilis TaxID=10195 RepID=A0A3M7SE83_BRAPC|nr:hypothetical protein BpHYR1_009860 [Brachionus plicatilis]
MALGNGLRGIYFKLYTIPLEIKNLLMGEKRKRGAPKKATKALVKIDDGNILVKEGNSSRSITLGQLYNLKVIPENVSNLQQANNLDLLRW